MKEQRKNKISYYGTILFIYMKYQILTKLMVFLLVFPFFNFVSNSLIKASGRVSISSGDYLSFLFSLKGLWLLFFGILFLVLLIGLDINAFIIMSALIKEGRIKLRARELLVVGIKSLKSFLRPSGFLIALYVAFIIPLVGIGLSVSVMKNFKIPNFISDVIFKNKLYLSAYLLLMLVLFIITLAHIFFFHYLIIDEQSIKNSLKKSFSLMRKHFKKFIKEMFKFGFFYFLYFGIGFLLLGILYLLVNRIDNSLFQKAFAIFVSVSFSELLAYTSFMSIPLFCYKLTDLFYRFNEEDGYKISLKLNIKADFKEDFEKPRLRTKISFSIFILLVLIFNISISILAGIFFEDFFATNKNIEIVAHRGGGDLAAENSILGMEKAYKEGASWSEIDVQRTKDGAYIINHDKNFLRVAGSSKKSSELTLEEVKRLRIRDLFDKSRSEEEVPTLEEYLEAAKGKIGLYIELKGSTADFKMVDDVVSLVKQKGMEKEVAILSLDYKLIEYSESKYPEIDTGYLYFFSIGDTKNLIADILIMEEQEATRKNIVKIHEAGKKAVVWTVNTDESINKFVLSEVDGIITDYVVKVKEGIKERDERSYIEIIIDSIFN